MSTQFRFEGFDDLFLEAQHEKIIVNDYDGESTKVKEKLDGFIMRNDVEEAISIKPSCICGQMEGGCYIGQLCPNCMSQVTSPLDAELKYLVWLRQPKGVAPYISPFIMELLLRKYYISTPNVKLVEYIIRTDYRITGVNRKNVGQLDKLDTLLKQAGIARGYNSFVENFFQILEILEKHYPRGPKRDRGKFVDWLYSIKDKIFSGWLPIPNRSLFAFDTNEIASYLDRTVIHAISAVRRITGIDLFDDNQQRKENKVANAILDMTAFYTAYLDTSFFKKGGLFRKQIARTKSHYTLRAVVTSRGGPHNYDEVESPWTATMSLLRPVIINGLKKRGMSQKQAEERFYTRLKKYCPVINEIFEEVIRNTGGIPILLNRNPSLHQGSIEFVFITKVKTSPTDNTLSVSYLLSPVFNMDFDGDMLNVTLLMTEPAIRNAENFRPYHNLLALKGPNELSGAIGLTKTNSSTLYNWFKCEPLD